MSAKVLIVDDEKDFLEIMAERMGARGMEVSTTTSAEKALKMVLKESYDAVIMDLMMPEMDGFKALKLFKETRPDLQIILLTANVPEEKCIEAIKRTINGDTDYRLQGYCRNCPSQVRSHPCGTNKGRTTTRISISDEAVSRRWGTMR